MKNKPYELIIFDWDGTLMDSEVQIITCMQRAAKTCKVRIPTDNEVRHIIGLGLTEAVQAIYPNANQQDIQQMFDAFRVHFLGADRPPSRLFPQVEAILEQLNDAGYLLAVATGKGRAGLASVLVETGLKHYFITTRCADETFSKPHPQMLEEILYYVGLESHQALMVGDTTYDIEMAANAKMDSLGVAWGVHPSENLIKTGAKACLKQSLTELPIWLNH